MKRLVILLAGMMFTWAASAKTADMFTYNHQQVDQLMASVNVLDHYVSTHAVTADQLDKDNPLLAGFRSQSDLPLASDNAALGIPGFWWGLILGWVGILIVYLVTEDQEETKQALYGCIVNAVLWVGCYFLFLAGSVATASAYGY